MIFIDRVKLFPKWVKNLVVRNVPSKNRYTIIFYPENTDFFTAYPTLQLKRIFCKRIFLFNTVKPRTIITGELIQSVRDLGIIPVRQIQPSTDNVFIDFGRLLDATDVRYGKGSYQRKSVYTTIHNSFEFIKTIDDTRKNILYYYIDWDKEFPKNIYYRRIWALLQQYKVTKSYPFDYFIVAFHKQGVVTYTCFKTPEYGELPFTRILAILNNIKPQIFKDEKEDVIDETSENIASSIDVQVDEPYQDDTEKDIETPESIAVDKVEIQKQKQRNIIKTAVSSFLSTLPKEEVNTLHVSGTNIPDHQKYDIATKSILYATTHNKQKTIQFVNNVPDDKKKDVFNKVKAQLLNDIVQKSKSQNNSRHPLVGNINLINVLENKEPSHLLNKRILDFSENFERDIKNSFSTLSKGDYPLKISSFKKVTIPVDDGDLNPSKYVKYEIVMKDDKGKNHYVEIQIPEIQKDGTFLLNGKKKFLIYQILLDPIFFIKKDQAKIESLYAAVSVHLKRTARKTYYDIRIGGPTLPLMALMGHYIGPQETFKLFGVTYTILNSKPEDTTDCIELSDEKYICFKYTKPFAKYLIESIKEIPFEFTVDNFFDKSIWKDAIISVTKNRNCIFKIDQVLQNIMEPVCVQILKSKLLPHDLPHVILYICEGLYNGRVDDRNNLRHQRIRSSEVFVHQIQKKILGAYTEYRTRRISGDSGAEYRLDITQVVKEIVNSQLVRDLENINPTEELSCMTRLTPIGDGGVPDTMAITKKARSIHASYHGSIDAHDSPEGSLFSSTLIRVNSTENKQILDVEVGDTVLWIDGNTYPISYKHVHDKPKNIIKTKFGDIDCSAEHRWPVYDTKENKEILLTTSEIIKDIKRYKLIMFE